MAPEVIPTGFLQPTWIRHVDAYYSTATQPHRHRYQTDLTDAEWRVIAPHLPQPCATGRPRAWPMREIINGMAAAAERLSPVGDDLPLVRRLAR
jgi:hypothetical protein